MGVITNPELTAVNASMAQVEQDLKALVPGMGVIAKRSGDTKYTADSEAYSFRKTPSAAGGAVNIESIIGASVGWNQLMNIRTQSTSTQGITITTGNGSASYVGTATAEGINNISSASNSVTIGHKYLIWLSNTIAQVIQIRKSNASSGDAGAIRSFKNSIMFTPESGVDYILFRYHWNNGASVNDEFSLCVYDLTAMLGTTIADYIYSLEQATAGAGVEWIRENCPSLLEYHEYDAGSIKSVNTSGRRATGKNLLTDEKYLQGHSVQFGYSGSYSATNYTGFFLAGTYTFSFTATDNDQTNLYVLNVDTGEYSLSSGITKKYTFTLSKGGNYAIWVYKSSYASVDVIQTAQLEFGSTATAYEPYKGITYPTTASDLRGIFKLTDGKLTADGDVYLPSGIVTRKYGIVDLGTLDWHIYPSVEPNTFVANPPNSSTQPSMYRNWMVITKYSPVLGKAWDALGDKECCIGQGVISGTIGAVAIKDTSYSTIASFAAAVSGVYLVYELATPTTETLAPYSAVQNAFADGTEEWVDTRSVALPVPNSAQYASNEQDKLNSLMGAAGADGTYAVKQESGQMALLSVPLLVGELKGQDIYDFNNMTATGIYWCYVNPSTCVNYPAIYNGVLLVFSEKGGDGIVQVFIDRTNVGLYVRRYNSSGWGSWATK